MSVHIVLAAHDGPNDARTTLRETRGMPLDPGCKGLARRRAGPRRDSARRQAGRGRVDGREPDAVSISYLFDSNWRRGGARWRRFNACARWPQPAQEKLNQQHQHKGLASIRRQVEPAGWGIPYRCFVGVGLTRMQRPPPCALARGLRTDAPKRHRPRSAFNSALNF